MDEDASSSALKLPVTDLQVEDERTAKRGVLLEDEIRSLLLGAMGGRDAHYHGRAEPNCGRAAGAVGDRRP